MLSILFKNHWGFAYYFRSQMRISGGFWPVFSTRSDGSGLGLAISYQIIHEHGGFIDLESEVGKGTSFRIHLPLKVGGKGVPGK